MGTQPHATKEMSDLSDTHGDEKKKGKSVCTNKKQPGHGPPRPNETSSCLLGRSVHKEGQCNAAVKLCSKKTQ